MKKLIIDNNYCFYNKLKDDSKYYLVDYNNINNSNYFNPLLIPYKEYKKGNTSKALDLLEGFAKYIFKDEKACDPFWTDTSCDLFCGLALFLFEKANVFEINIVSIFKMVVDFINDDEIRKNFVKYLDSKNGINTIDVLCSTTLRAPLETRAGIISVFKQKLNLYVLRNKLCDSLIKNDIDDDKDIILELGDKYNNLYEAVIFLFKEEGYIIEEYKDTSVTIRDKVKHKDTLSRIFDINEFINYHSFE